MRGGWGHRGDGPPDWQRWGPHRRRRPLGCLIFVALVFAAGLGVAGVWAVGTAAGLLSAPPVIRVGAIMAVVLGLIVIVGVLRGVRRLSAPLDALIDAAVRIEGGDLTARVDEQGPGEVRALARSFNAMSERLDANERQRRRFLADIAHELRTPLTVIQGRIEGVIDGVYPADAAHLEPALDELRALERLIEDLRTLSMAETGTLTLALEAVEPALLVNDVVATFSPTARATGVELRAALPPDLPSIEADPGRLRQALANLVSNALAHTPPGGSVTVSAAAANGTALEVAVADTGEGIPAELLPRAFDRFVKGAGSRGSGLGLAIARDLVTAHGGTIAVSSEGPGRGTIVRVRLPLGGAAGPA
ncbi:MAG: HAMP domain-containing histidine kinase [Chloroflexi bacterium]|nr:HAMP domain-containing histidine kinase [Chloroflexota bacterium]